MNGFNKWNWALHRAISVTFKNVQNISDEESNQHEEDCKINRKTIKSMSEWINLCWEQQRAEDECGGEWFLALTSRPWRRTGGRVLMAASSTVPVGHPGWRWGGNPEAEAGRGSNPAELQERPDVLGLAAGARPRAGAPLQEVVRLHSLQL